MGKKVTLPNPKAKSKEKKKMRTILNFFYKGHAIWVVSQSWAPNFKS